MIVGKYIIHKSSYILNILASEPKDEKLYDRMMQIYECRLFGLCVYRNEQSFKKLESLVNKKYLQ